MRPLLATFAPAASAWLAPEGALVAEEESVSKQCDGLSPTAQPKQGPVPRRLEIAH